MFGITFVHWLALVSACVSLVGAAAYIRDIVRGKTKPNRVSWSMWAATPLIAASAAFAAHADAWVTARVFLSGLLPLVILIVALANARSYWKLSVFDFACGALAVLALIAWGVADSPRMAILLAALGDCFASMPTFRKAWSHPETETLITYSASFAAALLILPSIPHWNIENSAYQIYLLTINGLLFFAVYRKRWGLFIDAAPATAMHASTNP